MPHEAPIRVLLLTPSAQAGGAERALVALASLLPRHGFETSIVLLEHGPLEQWLAAADCDYAVAPPETVTDDATATAWLVQEAASLSVAAVLSNKSQGHLIGGPAAECLGVPAVWWQQDIAGRSEYELAAAAIPAALVIASSDYALAAQYALTPEADIRKVHLGVPVERVAGRRGAGEAIRLAIDRERNALVGIVGRLEAWKGQDVFLRAAGRVSAEHPGTRFAIVGGSLPGKEVDYPVELRALADGLGLGERVHFTGHLTDVFPWFDALDVSVHATHGEPFGLVLVEAMALGKPLIATALGGPVEIIEEGVSGLLVPPGDEEAMARAICRVLSDGGLAARLAEGGRQRASEFTDARMAAAFAGLLHELLPT